MVCIKYITIITILSIILVGCSNNREIVLDNSPEDLYAFAKKKLKEGHYKVAIKELEKLDQYYPFSSYVKKAQIDLIYAYYKSNDLLLVPPAVDRFLHLNPTHPNIDYVLYIRGLAHMALDDTVLHGFFKLDQSNRNAEHARIAFHDLKQLITNHPNSQYAMDAIRRLYYLKHRLARHELCIVQYYSNRGAYVAVVNRVEKMLKDFPDTQATLKALWYMEKAYRSLKLDTLANKVARIIMLNSD